MTSESQPKSRMDNCSDPSIAFPPHSSVDQNRMGKFTEGNVAACVQGSSDLYLTRAQRDALNTPENFSQPITLIVSDPLFDKPSSIDK